ncbi:uncharacterized protein [Nicotiana sylvestris]|uniref:Uncharacterized protein LOC104234509 n=1 Tax=Nicotiana sylvestris TaxID=4096 RepID=A0A1U7X9Q4_NICSY|nr:PREDICTED: uncharacterized protein LOC104234509 [Nicotiana sylvestris]
METYSFVVDAIILWYLINLAVHEKLDMRLMDVVTSYLYGSLDNEFFMKILEEFKVSEAHKSSRKTCSIKLQKSLYGLKQSERMWYNPLSKYLLKKRYKNDPICPSNFIKRSGSEFVTIAVYVDDLNTIDTSKELPKVVECFKAILHEKCTSIEYSNDCETASHKSRSISPQQNDEELVGDETPYLSAIGLLMYLANNTDHILLLQFKSEMIDYADAGYLSDPHIKPDLKRAICLYMEQMCGFLMKKDNPTTLYEDNVACIAQLKGGYIKGDWTKCISPKKKFTHDLQQNGEINGQQIRSSKSVR